MATRAWPSHKRATVHQLVMSPTPALMRLPPELRAHIYEYLLDVGKDKQIYIRNKHLKDGHQRATPAPSRSYYYTVDRSIGKRTWKTTYCIQGDKTLHMAILGVNRKMREEASHMLYARHSFDFADHIEAVAPFFEDRAVSSRDLVQEITLHKQGPMMPIESDAQAWAATCRILQTAGQLKRLTLVIGGGRPNGPWDGPQSLSVSDLKLLYETRHECLEWARELARVKSVEVVEISADLSYLAPPSSNAMLIFAAFSASIETTLIDFLREELGIPARTPHALKMKGSGPKAPTVGAGSPKSAATALS